jgi:hypothetical protein
MPQHNNNTAYTIISIATNKQAFMEPNIQASIGQHTCIQSVPDGTGARDTVWPENVLATILFASADRLQLPIQHVSYPHAL